MFHLLDVDQICSDDNNEIWDDDDNNEIWDDDDNNEIWDDDDNDEIWDDDNDDNEIWDNDACPSGDINAQNIYPEKSHQTKPQAQAFHLVSLIVFLFFIISSICLSDV